MGKRFRRSSGFPIFLIPVIRPRGQPSHKNQAQIILRETWSPGTPSSGGSDDAAGLRLGRTGEASVAPRFVVAHAKSRLPSTSLGMTGVGIRLIRG
jgi:hypothetical protein